MGSIADRIARARAGANDALVCRLESGWVVMGDRQFLPGYCMLLADPVVPDLNRLASPARAAFRLKPVWFYDWSSAPKYSPTEHGALRDALQRALTEADPGAARITSP